MSIDDFRSFILFVIKKSQSGGNPKPSEFNLAVERGYMQFIMSRYGNQEEYVPGRPVPRIAWQQSQKISDDLRFLLTIATFAVGNDGKLVIPDGTTATLEGATAPKYLHHSSLRFNFSKTVNGDIVSKEVPIDILTDAEIGNVLASEVVPATTRFPVAAYYDTFIQFAPKNLQKVIFTYLRIPVPPKWAFTLDDDDRPVYDEGNSVDIEAPDQVINEIAFNTLAFMGLSIRDQFIFQAAKQFVAEGV